MVGRTLPSRDSVYAYMVRQRSGRHPLECLLEVRVDHREYGYFIRSKRRPRRVHKIVKHRWRLIGGKEEMHVYMRQKLRSACHPGQTTFGFSINVVGIALRNRGLGVIALETAQPWGYPGRKARDSDDGRPRRPVTAEIQIACDGALGFSACQHGKVPEKCAVARI